MEFANAGKLDRKSGVRFGERGAPVPFPSTFVMVPYFCRRLFITMASMAPDGVT
jgi:hypothetical protein